MAMKVIYFGWVVGSSNRFCFFGPHGFVYTAENDLMRLLPAARAEVSSLPTAGAEVSWRDISLWLETSLLFMMAVTRGLEAAA